jgi:hypothetical protein
VIKKLALSKGLTAKSVKKGDQNNNKTMKKAALSKGLLAKSAKKGDQNKRKLRCQNVLQ